jgi:hypothetical protein
VGRQNHRMLPYKQAEVYLSAVPTKCLGEAGGFLDLREVLQERERGVLLYGARETDITCYIM